MSLARFSLTIERERYLLFGTRFRMRVWDRDRNQWVLYNGRPAAPGLAIPFRERRWKTAAEAEAFAHEYIREWMTGNAAACPDVVDGFVATIVKES